MSGSRSISRPEENPVDVACSQEYPRLSLMKGLKANMCLLCEAKPQTTYDNTVGEWGDRYVEGYSRKGKLTQDLLETCNLDDL